MLETAGFAGAASLSGGIRAWHGLIAEGPPGAGQAFFSAAADAADLIALAWLLEDGSRTFYSALADMHPEPEVSGLFGDLVKAEQKHKGMLVSLFHEITGKKPGPEFPSEMPAAEGARGRMEGNVFVAEAVSWAKGRALSDLLELCMALETQSYDLYIRMGRTVTGEQARKVFSDLVSEEKKHLARLSELLDRDITGKKQL